MLLNETWKNDVNKTLTELQIRILLLNLGKSWL